MDKSIGFTGVLVLIGGCAAPSIIPQQLNPGVKESMTLIVPAKGVQIYECRASKDKPGAYEWAFVAPERSCSTRPASRSAGTTPPSWEASDGSKIAGAVKARADAPAASAIPGCCSAPSRSAARARSAR